MVAPVFQMVYTLHPTEGGSWSFADAQGLRAFWVRKAPEMSVKEGWLDLVERQLVQVFVSGRDRALSPEGKDFSGPWVRPSGYGITLQGDDGSDLLILAEGLAFSSVQQLEQQR